MQLYRVGVTMPFWESIEIKVMNAATAFVCKHTPGPKYPCICSPTIAHNASLLTNSLRLFLALTTASFGFWEQNWHQT